MPRQELKSWLEHAATKNINQQVIEVHFQIHIANSKPLAILVPLLVGSYSSAGSMNYYLWLIISYFQVE